MPQFLSFVSIEFFFEYLFPYLKIRFQKVFYFFFLFFGFLGDFIS